MTETINIPDMTEGEKMQFGQMQGDVKQIKEDQTKIGVKLNDLTNKVGQIYTAIVGDELNGYGFNQRLEEQGKKITVLEETVAKMEKLASTYSMKVTIMWTALGVIFGGILTAIGASILKNLH